jgi:hypothetical protein
MTAAGELGVAGDRAVGEAVKLGLAPEASEVLPAVRGVVAVEGDSDLPHVVAGAAALGASGRGEPRRKRGRKRSREHKQTSHSVFPLLEFEDLPPGKS